MAGKKRTRTGQIKSPEPAPEPTPNTTEPTPPCAQPPLPSSTSTEEPNVAAQPKKQKTKQDNPKDHLHEANQHNADHPRNLHHKTKPKSHNRQKMRRLPSNVTISKRPLLHPALPTPYASSSSPKIIYLTATSPFIPCLKRIRKLLDEVRKRETQSNIASARNNRRRAGNAQANGRLAPKDVERDIVDGVAAKGQKKGEGEEGEQIYVKATGRAIPRALEVGLHFQHDGEFRVRVEMGSVNAIDDIEVRTGEEGEEEMHKEGEEEEQEEEELPESRMRTLSCVTVSIGMK